MSLLSSIRSSSQTPGHERPRSRHLLPVWTTGGRKGVEGPPSRICDWGCLPLPKMGRVARGGGHAPGPSQLLPDRRLPPPILGEHPSVDFAARASPLLVGRGRSQPCPRWRYRHSARPSPFCSRAMRVPHSPQKTRPDSKSLVHRNGPPGGRESAPTCAGRSRTPSARKGTAAPHPPPGRQAGPRAAVRPTTAKAVSSRTGSARRCPAPARAAPPAARDRAAGRDRAYRDEPLSSRLAVDSAPCSLRLQGTPSPRSLSDGADRQTLRPRLFLC